MSAPLPSLGCTSCLGKAPRVVRRGTQVPSRPDRHAATLMFEPTTHSDASACQSLSRGGARMVHDGLTYATCYSRRLGHRDNKRKAMSLTLHATQNRVNAEQK